MHYRKCSNCGKQLKRQNRCTGASDPELCHLLQPYMRNPCPVHSHSRQTKVKKGSLRRRSKKRSMFGDCSKACNPELCRLLKPYMRRRRRY